MPHRLITRSDDAGTFRSANRAILETCTQGICRNVSLMGPCPEIEDAAAVFKGHDEICFGMHATITCEWQHPRWGPCADPATVPGLLAEDGAFVHAPADVHERGCPTEQILIELQAQLERLQGLGLTITYVDTHMPWDWMHPPGAEDQRIEQDLARWAQERGLLYWKQWGEQVGRLPKLEQPPADAIEQRIATLRAFANGPEATALDIQHPCFDDAEMTSARDRQGGSGHGAKRDLQRRNFMDPAVLAAIQETGIQPIRYDEVG